MHMGFRRYNVKPIYSQNTNKGSNNVHKFERFIQLGRSYVATVYGPIAFGKTPVTFYKETENPNGKIISSVKKRIKKLTSDLYRTHLGVYRYIHER